MATRRRRPLSPPLPPSLCLYAPEQSRISHTHTHTLQLCVPVRSIHSALCVFKRICVKPYLTTAVSLSFLVKAHWSLSTNTRWSPRVTVHHTPPALLCLLGLVGLAWGTVCVWLCVWMCECVCVEQAVMLYNSSISPTDSDLWTEQGAGPWISTSYRYHTVCVFMESTIRILYKTPSY